MGSSLQYWSIMNRMYFTPAWMLASIWVMSPTFSSFPVGGMTWLLLPLGEGSKSNVSG